jgi:hypothetical protein
LGFEQEQEQERSYAVMFKSIRKILKQAGKWVSADYYIGSESSNEKKGIDWIAAIPFLLFHVMIFGIIRVGWSPFAVLFALVFYIIRMFGITAFYHSYFSHHSFKANRFFSFFFGLLGYSAMQHFPSTPSITCSAAAAIMSRTPAATMSRWLF